MKIKDWNKLIGLVIVDLGIIALAFAHIINEQAVIAVLSASLGYVFGNTHGAIEDKIDIKSEMKKINNGG
jgi:hypothetical protein